MGVMNVMDRVEGDTTVGWDKNNPDEIEQAQASFDSLLAKGYMAYKVTKEGTKTGEQIKKFDPTLERIILAPALVGG
jgi:phosphoribosylformimino-5-aminoimidazole carboxamide ribonucleotide (ProFAR) isomerase